MTQIWVQGSQPSLWWAPCPIQSQVQYLAFLPVPSLVFSVILVRGSLPITPATCPHGLRGAMSYFNCETCWYNVIESSIRDLSYACWHPVVCIP